jgi:HAD superfamily hydrolase (TIGR01549 family)
VIKAVFFDWFDTLACYNPPREELYSRAFKECGIEVSLRDIHKGLMAADRYYFAQVSNKVFTKSQNFTDRVSEFVFYPQSIAVEAALTISPEIQLKIVMQVLQNFNNSFILFKDTLPIFKVIKNLGLLSGIITNADEKIINLVRDLGLNNYIEIIITSQKIGVEKPSPRIFMAALEQAKVNSSEAIYVGDQYQSDILGAGGVGMQAILLDRYDIHSEVQDYPRIRTLTELSKYLV